MIVDKRNNVNAPIIKRLNKYFPIFHHTFHITKRINHKIEYNFPLKYIFVHYMIPKKCILVNLLLKFFSLFHNFPKIYLYICIINKYILFICVIVYMCIQSAHISIRLFPTIFLIMYKNTSIYLCIMICLLHGYEHLIVDME